MMRVRCLSPPARVESNGVTYHFTVEQPVAQVPDMVGRRLLASPGGNFEVEA